MATLTSTTYDNQVGSAGASPAASYPDAMEANGKLRYLIGKITTGTAVANGDIWKIGRLPLNCTPIAVMSRVANESGGGTSDTVITIDIGYSSNPDALSDALDVSAAGEKAFSDGGTVAATELTPAKITTEADRDIYATVSSGSATSVDGAKDYTFYVAFLSE